MVPYLAAGAILAGSAFLGQAAFLAAGVRRWSWLSPAVGLALLLVIATAAIKLPGGATTAAVVIAVAVAASAVIAFRMLETRPSWLLLVIPAAAAVTAIPFLAKGHVGILGMSFNNDPSFHLIWAEGLRSKATASLYPLPELYPLAPHALLAAFAQGLGTDVAQVFVGLLIVIPVMTALAAMQGLRGAPGPLRVAGALAVAFAYLAAAYFAEAAFKEGLMALFLLTFALGLNAIEGPAPARRVLPLAILVAGGLLAYTYFALAWFASAAAGFVLLRLVFAWPSRAAWRRATRPTLLLLLVGAAVTLVAIAPDLGRTVQFYDSVGASPASGGGGIPKANTGNIGGPIPLREVLGVWPSHDFRVHPVPETSLFAALELLALGALLYGVFWHVRRREFGVVAALAGALGVYAITDTRESVYVVAKSLAIMAPLAVLVMARPLLVREPGPAGGASVLWSRFRLALALVLGLALAQSSLLVLRAAAVESPAQRDQLAELRPLVGHHPTLFLPSDDFAAWRLRGVPLGFFGGSGLTSPLPILANPAKPWKGGEPADFDSVSARGLDRFDFAISARGAYTSAAPANFRPVRSTQLYTLWRRSGPTARRVTVEPPTDPIGILSCRSVPSGTARRWSQAPVITPGPLLLSGVAAPMSLPLPAGTWDLSMQYLGTIPVRVEAGGRRVATIPANTGLPGPYWPALRVTSSGAPVQLLLIGERQSRLTSTNDYSSILKVAATPVPLGRDVPARRACGRPTDHLQPAAPGR